MTEAPPARIRIYFASAAPVALIVRNGPRKRTRFLLWHTDDDRIEPGHWLKGRVESATLSPDGRYIAFGATDSQDGNQYGAVSRAPWATALLFVEGGHCVGSIPDMYADGSVFWVPYKEVQWRAPEETCPFKVFRSMGDHPVPLERNRMIGNAQKGVDGRGRAVEILDGRILVDGVELIDLNPMKFEPIVPPDWAREW